MTAIPNSTSLIQIEATRFRSAVSESTAQAMGGAINYSLNTLPNKAELANLNNTAAAAGVAQNGTYPYPGSTSIKVRLDNVIANVGNYNGIVDLYNNAFSLGGGPSVRMGTDGTFSYFTQVRYDTGTYTVYTYRQANTGGTITSTMILDTGVAFALNRFATTEFAATSANLFMRLHIFEYTAIVP